jgi:hypothetical protein
MSAFDPLRTLAFPDLLQRMEEKTPVTVLKLRVRNNIMDYLELASSPSEQRDYERRVPIAHVPNEMINGKIAFLIRTSSGILSRSFLRTSRRQSSGLPKSGKVWPTKP